MLAVAWAADWPQYRGPKSNGHSFEPGVAKAWPEGGPKVLWEGAGGEGFGTFAVRGERAFLFVNRDGKETAVAMDASNGNEIWAQPLDQSITDTQGGSNPRLTPAVDGDHVYFFTVNLKLACLSVPDGRPKWQLDISATTAARTSGGATPRPPCLTATASTSPAARPGRSMMAVNKNTGRPSGPSATRPSPTPRPSPPPFTACRRRSSS